jgi:hypothetical protein
MYSVTRDALDAFDNPREFERLCADVLNMLGYQQVVLVGPKGGGDGGKDITYTSPEGKRGLAWVTLREDIDRKVKADAAKRKAGDFDEYTLFSTAYLTPKQKAKFQDDCQQHLQADLVVFDVEGLRSLLDTKLRHLRKQYLHIEDADLRQREQEIEQRRVALRERGIAVRQRYVAELDDPRLQGRWARGSHRLYFELLAPEAPDDVFPFGVRLAEGATLDDLVLARLRQAYWIVREDTSDDIWHLPQGVGIVALYTGHTGRPRPLLATHLTQPVSTLYLNRAGGLFATLPTAALGDAQPNAMQPNLPALIQQLLLRLASLTHIVLELLKAQGYTGRVQATLWTDLSLNPPPQLQPDKTHWSMQELVPLDPWNKQAEVLSKLVSQVTRSWLSCQFTLESWPERGLPVLV